MRISEAVDLAKANPGQWFDLPAPPWNLLAGGEWFDLHEVRDHPETGVTQFRRRSEADIARRRALH